MSLELTKPGGDIFVHGGTLSIGCLAIGDRAIEELFVIVHRVGPPNVKVTIAPNDVRKVNPVTDPSSVPAWVPGLYQRIQEQLQAFTTTKKGR